VNPEKGPPAFIKGQEERPMKIELLFTALVSLFIGGAYFGCTSVPIVGEKEGLKVSLDVPDTVGAGRGYPAIFYFSPPEFLKGKIIVGGDFWWNSEGPFKIPHSEVNEKEGFVRFMLRTANPGTFNISGKVNFVTGDGLIKATQTLYKKVQVN
jgi:hypothetical protein